MTGNKKFIYRCGQRPLDGYTLKRGVGQGAFGEVYFAVSDGGKEVALKLLRGHTDAELRGISHCLNLKHPNLVHLYDLRTDSRGEKWVVMEYVFGESLAQVIDRYPNGLPTELIREWFAALARGVAYLHDRGVIHRDLKPANVFIEQGSLKIGDYGLSRRISGSDRGDVTRGVGTPHYMAPEVRNGNYGVSVDVYACGVILYEMLVGHPPFEGETPAEVLMRHQLDPPDLEKVPVAFRAVVEQALAKDPQKRFRTVTDLARAVESVFSNRPPSDPAVARHSTPAIPPNISSIDTVVDERVRLPVPRLVRPAAPNFRRAGPFSFRERATELLGSLCVAPLVCAACTAPWVMLQTTTPWTVLGRVFLLATTLSWALLVLSLLPGSQDRNTWGRRAIQLLIGLGIGTLCFWLDGWALPKSTATATSRDLVLWTGHRVSPEALSVGVRYLFYFGLATAACRWWIATDYRRRERFRVFPIVAALFWGTVFVFLWPWESAPVILGLAPLGIAAVAIQATSPWSATEQRSRLEVRV